MKQARVLEDHKNCWTGLPTPLLPWKVRRNLLSKMLSLPTVLLKVLLPTQMLCYKV